jgi:hypothetical protein
VPGGRRAGPGARFPSRFRCDSSTMTCPRHAPGVRAECLSVRDTSAETAKGVANRTVGRRIAKHRCGHRSSRTGVRGEDVWCFSARVRRTSSHQVQSRERVEPVRSLHSFAFALRSQEDEAELCGRRRVDIFQALRSTHVQRRVGGLESNVRAIPRRFSIRAEFPGFSCGFFEERTDAALSKRFSCVFAKDT